MYLVAGLALCLAVGSALVLTMEHAERAAAPPVTTDRAQRLPAPVSAETPQFIDVTDAAGIDFVHSIGDAELDSLVEAVGSGAAFLDYDQDGFLDLFVLNMQHLKGVSKGEAPKQQPTGRLYHNLKNGTFEDVTARSGLAKPCFGLGVAVGDYDNDGFPDIFLANYGPDCLYRNRGDGTFKDVTEKAGVSDPRCSVGAVFLDYDNDGLLDLYVVNYVQYDPDYKYFFQPDGFPGPLAYEGQADALYRNRGDGTFEDVSQKAGISSPAMRGMGATAADIDLDGDTDIFVANDVAANFLWINDGKGHFTDKALPMGVAFNHCGEGTASMIGVFGDYDGDGYLDLFVPDDSFHALFRNTGQGMFLDSTVNSGIAQMCGQYVTWAAGFCDFDNDGDLDIYCVNGPLHHLWGEEDILLENVGEGRFQDISTRSGDYFRSKRCGRGACFGDYDNDGDVDVFVTNLNDRPVLLRNDGGNRRHFLTVRLEGTRSNRDAVGAVVEVCYDGKRQVSQRFNGGYLSANDPRVHFGLGEHQTVKAVRVRWPSGAESRLEDVLADRILHIKEPAQSQTGQR